MTQTPKKPRREAQPTLRDRADALRARVPNTEPDPVLAMIRDGHRLLEEARKASRLPTTVEGVRPAADEDATADLFEHLRETIPQTPPETPVGAVALAKYVVGILDVIEEDEIQEELIVVLKLIAEVRLA